MYGYQPIILYKVGYYSHPYFFSFQMVSIELYFKTILIWILHINDRIYVL